MHLAAELIENATAFSSAQVQVTAGMLASGGALIEITDEGLGIADQDLARANWRLDHPPVIDVGVSRRMGLFVVGRLAARHGIRVRLKHAQPRGLSALVWLPDSVAQLEVTTVSALQPQAGTGGYLTAAPGRGLVPAGRRAGRPAGGRDRSPPIAGRSTQPTVGIPARGTPGSLGRTAELWGR